MNLSEVREDFSCLGRQLYLWELLLRIFLGGFRCRSTAWVWRLCTASVIMTRRRETQLVAGNKGTVTTYPTSVLPAPYETERYHYASGSHYRVDNPACREEKCCANKTCHHGTLEEGGTTELFANLFGSNPFLTGDAPTKTRDTTRNTATVADKSEVLCMPQVCAPCSVGCGQLHCDLLL